MLGRPQAAAGGARGLVARFGDAVGDGHTARAHIGHSRVLGQIRCADIRWVGGVQCRHISRRLVNQAGVDAVVAGAGRILAALDQQGAGRQTSANDSSRESLAHQLAPFQVDCGRARDGWVLATQISTSLRLFPGAGA